MATLTVRVVSPDRVVYEGEASSVVAPGWDGQIGFQPGHAPLITLLGAGPLDVDQPGGGSVRFHLAGGTVKVENDVVTILTEYAGDAAPEVLPEGSQIHPEDLLDGASAGNIFA